MKEIIIHIGYSKTGTKALQRNLFSKHPDILYLGSPFTNQKIKDLVKIDIMKKDMIEYDNAATRESFFKEIDAACKKRGSSKKIFLSYEMLSCSFNNQPDRSIVAKKLADIFRNAKIIITVRNQLTYIPSVYKQGIFSGMYMNFHAFLTSFWEQYHCSFFPQFKYYEFIKIYEEIFGRDNILILCYEELRDNPQDFLRKICKFAGISETLAKLPYENVGLSRQSLAIKRMLNRIVRYRLGKPHYMPTGENIDFKNFRLIYMRLTNTLTRKIDRVFGLKDYQIRMPQEWRARLTRLYAESNRKLYQEYKIDIKKYNYPGL